MKDYCFEESHTCGRGVPHGTTEPSAGLERLSHNLCWHERRRNLSLPKEDRPFKGSGKAAAGPREAIDLVLPPRFQAVQGSDG